MSILDEKQLTLMEAARLLPGKTHHNTLRRWASEGCNGTRLRTWKIGGKRCTSREALEQFIIARSGDHRPDATRMRSASHLQAEAELDSMGVK